MTHHWEEGCHRWYSCCCLLGPVWSWGHLMFILDSDNVLLQKVKVVEDPVGPSQYCQLCCHHMWSWSASQIMSAYYQTTSANQLSLYLAHLLLLSIICSSSWCPCIHLTFCLKRHTFPFSHSITLSSWSGVRIRGLAFFFFLVCDCDCDSVLDCDCDCISGWESNSSGSGCVEGNCGWSAPTTSPSSDLLGLGLGNLAGQSLFLPCDCIIKKELGQQQLATGIWY